ncbi:MAG: hypothetical protein J7M25_10860 [Deltaproteobacteria bacterium]|nr:hypothetical protein [Deltaproteobacteria bacterium]
MEEKAFSHPGVFGHALESLDSIKEFRKAVLENLEHEEQSLADLAWRQKFRRELPYWQLLGDEQKKHVRGIFSHMLPDPDIVVDAFDKNELLWLDAVAEQYVRQALVFAESVGDNDYRLVPSVERDRESRFVVLTLSASLFTFDVPDELGKRAYQYKNIYGNRSIPLSGRCRLKGGITVGEQLKTVEFHSSPVQLVAQGDAEVVIRGFDQDSHVFHRSFNDSFSSIPMKSQSVVVSLSREFTASQASAPDEVQKDADSSSGSHLGIRDMVESRKSALEIDVEASKGSDQDQVPDGSRDEDRRDHPDDGASSDGGSQDS